MQKTPPAKVPLGKENMKWSVSHRCVSFICVLHPCIPQQTNNGLQALSDHISLNLPQLRFLLSFQHPRHRLHIAKRATFPEIIFALDHKESHLLKLAMKNKTTEDNKIVKKIGRKPPKVRFSPIRSFNLGGVVQFCVLLCLFKSPLT